MKVLHVIPHLEPGGTERQLVSTIRAAHRRAWEATLCVLNPGYELARQLAADGIEVIELEQRRRRDPGRLVRLRSLITEGSFDVVHSTLWRCNEVVRLSLLGRRRRPAVVISERAAEWHRPRRERSADWALRPLTEGYIGNSAAVADFIAKAHRVPRERVTVVGNGVDTAVFRPSPAPSRSGRPRIGSLGRLEHQKGFDVLLDALPAVLDVLEVEVAIVGAGSLRGSLEAVVAERGLPVRFYGFLIDPAEVAEFLRSLDLFVLPTRYEGLPNAVLEAAACGIPVVSTDVPGVREAVGPDFELIPPDRPDELAVAIVEQLASRRTPEAPILSFDEVADRHLEAFRRALERRP